MSTRATILAAVAALAFMPTTAAASTAFDGLWVGTPGRGELALEISGDGTAATIYALGQDAIAFDADAVAIEDDSLAASFDAISASIEAAPTSGGLEVTWRQPGFENTVTFTRSDAIESVDARKAAIAAGVHGSAPLATAQFAFLVGTWEGTRTRLGPDGEYVETGTIRWEADWIADGMAIQNTSQSRDPSGRIVQWGVDTRVFNRQANEWRHRYLDLFSGTFLELTWSADDNGVLVSGITPWMEPDGQMADHIIRIEVVDADTFRWSADMSRDGGETWTKDNQVEIIHRVR